MIDNYSSKEGK